MSRLNPYAKAILGAIVAGITAYQVALLTPGVTANEWAGVAVAVIGAFGTVWGTTNKPATPPAEGE